MDAGSQPRPENPRPDFAREPWVNLNGEWGFQFDDYDFGETQEWQKLDALEDKITVPFPYQSKLSGVGDESFHDVVWYKHVFKLPQSFSGKRVLLKFGAVDYEAKVWVNGKLVGVHKGGFTPFNFDVTEAVNPDDCNLLTLRALDTHGEQPRGKQASSLHPSGCLYMRVTGIWQTVWLEAVGKAYVKSFRVYPNLAGKSVKLQGEVTEIREKAAVKADAYFTEFNVGSAEAELQGSEFALELPLDYVRTWSPQAPDLYELGLTLKGDGETLDVVTSYFGMREVSVKGERVNLNGEPVYLCMSLDQGYYPDGLYTAPSDNALRSDVEAAKKLGLNGVRKHQMASDPRYLYWCDKLGLLVWAEMADWGMPLKHREAFWEEWRGVIERDYNHPCIIAWVPFNERSSAYKEAGDSETLAEVYRRTKALDPTRLVVDNSGYTHTETDIADIHDYTYDARVFRRNWMRWRGNGGDPPSPHRPLMVEGYRYQGQPVVISEWGGWGLRDVKPVVKRPYMSYGKPLKDEFTFVSKYRDMVEAMLAEPLIAGFCYTQLYDVEGEVNGFLTYVRRWKIPAEAIAQIHERVKLKSHGLKAVT